MTNIYCTLKNAERIAKNSEKARKKAKEEPVSSKNVIQQKVKK